MAAAPPAECSEKLIDLPTNDAATCWWLSINLALFHKKRRELDDYFAKDETEIDDSNKLGDVLKRNFKSIYDHYTNTTPLTSADLLAFRTLEEMKGKFNGEGFDIAGSNFQDASEYITTLFRYLNISSFTLIEMPYINIYDIYTNLAFNGKITSKVQLTEEDKLKGMKDTQQDKFNNNKNTELIIYYFPRRFSIEASEYKPVEYEISVLNTITIPLRTDENDGLVEDMDDESLKNPITQKYKLDAIVAVKPNHYFAYVNCTGTEKWFKYDAMSEGKLKIEFDTLDKLLESKEEAVSKKANLLFYSKV